MSFIVYPSTTLASTAGIEIPPTQQMSDCKMVSINNYSSYGLGIVLPGNVQDFVLPQQGKYLASDLFYGDSIKIYPVQMLQQAFSGISQTLTIIGYTKDERTPPAGTTFSVGTVVFVANAVNTIGGVATSVVNDGNGAGTQIVESIVNAEASSSVILTNDAQLTLGTSAHPGLVTINNAFGSAGQITVDSGGILTVNRAIHANSVTALASNDLALEVATSQKVVASVNNVDTFSINGSGINLLAGTLSFLVGSISRISVFKQAITTVLTGYAHGLGATPDAVFLQLLGTSTATATYKYDDTSLTNTQVKMIASTNCTVIVICIKF